MKVRLAPALVRELFIIAIGVAAFSHSMWSYAAFLGGRQPDPLQGGLHILHYIGWLLPGALLAFATDVGMIAVSVELRGGDRTAGKYAAFGLLAVVTYLLQWLYSVHHIEAIPLGTGVPEHLRGLAETVSTFLTVWLLPGALPLTAIAYTFSHPRDVKVTDLSVQEKRKVAPVASPVTVDVSDVASHRPLPTVIPLQAEGKVQKLHTATCVCGWSKDGYASERAAQNALTAHRRKCKVAA